MSFFKISMLVFIRSPCCCIVTNILFQAHLDTVEVNVFSKRVEHFVVYMLFFCGSSLQWLVLRLLLHADILFSTKFVKNNCSTVFHA